MRKTVPCKWCSRLLSAKRAYRCPICGNNVCAGCWGPYGDACIVCFEQAEIMDEGEEEEECEDEDEDWGEDCEEEEDCEDDWDEDE